MIVRSHLKALRSTIVAAGLATLILCQRHLGFMVLFEVIFATPWIACSLWIIVRNPQHRSLQSIKVGLWVVSMITVIVVHWAMATQTRANAQIMVDAIMEYATFHHTYPPDLQTLGYSNDDIRSKIGLSGYGFNNGKPYFFYASTYVPFETDHYDFAKREWEHSD